MCQACTSRRGFLKLSALAATAAALRPAAFASTLHAAPAGRIEPFPLSQVRLGAGVFRQQAETNDRYLDSLQVDRLLHSFRLTAGISSTAQPYRGWEDPTCELRGHFNGGHFLSACALSYATSGNEELKRKSDQVVAGLAECQKKIGSGYLSAYPSALFEHLAAGQSVWAPFYTYHKIHAGLLDAYTLTGNTQALQVAESMAQWVEAYFQAVSASQRQFLLRTEFGGMSESLANLAAITKKEQYLNTAHLFEQPAFLDPLGERRDELNGIHANTHVPKIIGAARMYEVSGEDRYRRIAQYFLDEVLTARTYAIGNTSLDEFWRTQPTQLQGTLAWKNAECCVAYNLMKLERMVFGWTGDARWMDAYERQLFNCRLGTQNPDGLKQYFFPLAAGYWRAFHSAEESFWCCTGTGAEDFAKFTDTIYFRRGTDLYVNQYLASTLEWKEQDLTLTQTTNFPQETTTTLRVQTSRAHSRAIHLRIPAWVAGAAEIKINGKPVEATADPGSYLALRRVWQNGDTIQLTLPMEARAEALPGDRSLLAAVYGPLVLAADLGKPQIPDSDRIIHSGDTAPAHVPAPDAAPHVAASADAPQAAWVEKQSGSDLRFKVQSGDKKLDLLPMYEVMDQKYAIYFQS